jgi:acyl-[acyl-carrier-protein] desaturase
MEDLNNLLVQHEWNLPLGDVRAMVCYSMVQELATWLNYRNLRNVVGKEGDPALYCLLGFITIDERAHYDFFRRLVQMHLEDDRPATLEALRQVMNQFSMPVVHMLSDCRQRTAAVKALRIFDDDIYLHDVYMPILADLKVDRREMRRRTAREVAIK